MVDQLAAGLSGVGLDWRLLSPEMQEYSRCCKSTAERLWLVWEDMGVSKHEQELELREITQKTFKVWGEAVDRAEAAREQMKAGLKNAVRKTQSIVDELREDGRRELSTGKAGLRTLRQEYEDALKILRKWRQCKQDRLQQVERARNEMYKLLGCLGIPHGEIELSGLSNEHLLQLSKDLHFYKEEKQRREMKLEAILAQLRKVCIELGEDDVKYASKAHPSLRYYREALPVHATIKRDEERKDVRIDPKPDLIYLDLSDKTFKDLQQFVEGLERQRVAHLCLVEELLEVLENLWEILGIPEMDMNRGIFSRLLKGPTRLHSTSIARCETEIRRLEDTNAASVNSAIEIRVRELEALCHSTHLQVPRLSVILPSLYDTYAAGDCGQTKGLLGRSCSHALGKLAKLIQEAKLLVNKRAKLVSIILEFEKAQGGAEWLATYEKDEERYKGRGSFRKLQKALRVGKVKDKLPEMTASLEDALAFWKQTEGYSFIFDGANYTQKIQDAKKRMEASCKKRWQVRQRFLDKDDSLLTTSMGRLEAKNQSLSRPKTAIPLKRVAYIRDDANSPSEELWTGRRSDSCPSMRILPQASSPTSDDSASENEQAAEAGMDPLQELLDNMVSTMRHSTISDSAPDLAQGSAEHKRRPTHATCHKDVLNSFHCVSCHGRVPFIRAGTTANHGISETGQPLSPHRFSNRYATG